MFSSSQPPASVCYTASQDECTVSTPRPPSPHTPTASDLRSSGSYAYFNPVAVPSTSPHRLREPSPPPPYATLSHDVTKIQTAAVTNSEGHDPETIVISTPGCHPGDRRSGTCGFIPSHSLQEGFVHLHEGPWNSFTWRHGLFSVASLDSNVLPSTSSSRQQLTSQNGDSGSAFRRHFVGVARFKPMTYFMERLYTPQLRKRPFKVS